MPFHLSDSPNITYTVGKGINRHPQSFAGRLTYKFDYVLSKLGTQIFTRNAVLQNYAKIYSCR